MTSDEATTTPGGERAPDPGGPDPRPAGEAQQHPSGVVFPPVDSVQAPVASSNARPPAPPPAWLRRMPYTNAAGWVATLLPTAIAAALRLAGLDRIRTLMFDETYYVKDAYSIWHLGYEGTWAQNVDPAFVRGDFSGLSRAGGFVVHPQTGKWLIGLGMRLFGDTNPVGWRISAAVFGILGVLLTCRIAWALFRSPAITALAGTFLATDGIHLVLSRTGLLDIFLSTFVLVAIWCVVRDQQRAHPLLVARLRAWEPPRGAGLRGGLGPSAGPRWWLLAAGVALGLACSVKWSGIYALATIGIFVAIRECTTRRRHGVRHWFVAALARDVWVAFLALVPPALATYVAAYWGWLAHPAAWGHGAGVARGASSSGLLGGLFDLWRYHVQMWNFHVNLHTPHTYQSSPGSWLLQLRPTSFAYQKTPGDCGPSGCIQNVVALGNPLMWWLAIPALALAVVATAWHRNWKTGVILLGYIAMYVPWFQYLHRTIFTFYTVAFAPYVALVLAWAIGVLIDDARLRIDPDTAYAEDERDWGPSARRWIGDRPRLRRAGLVAGILASLAVLGAAAYFYPVWTGVVMPYSGWLSRMWLQGWI